MAASYKGATRATIRHGVGRTTFSNASFTYEGEYVAGKRHGKGRLTIGSDGDAYEGDFSHGEMTGEGVRKASGRVLHGTFVSGRLHGRGALSCADGVAYTGEWVDGAYEGQGELRTPCAGGENVVRGSFSRHRAHGPCVEEAHGAGGGVVRSFEGEFVRGVREGDGVEVAVAGWTFAGRWRGGLRQGQGALTWSSHSAGISYTGAWEGGLATSPPSRAVVDLQAGPRVEEAAASDLSAPRPSAGVKKESKGGAPPPAPVAPMYRPDALVLSPGEPLPPLSVIAVEVDGRRRAEAEEEAERGRAEAAARAEEEERAAQAAAAAAAAGAPKKGAPAAVQAAAPVAAIPDAAPPRSKWVRGAEPAAAWEVAARCEGGRVWAAYLLPRETEETFISAAQVEARGKVAAAATAPPVAAAPAAAPPSASAAGGRRGSTLAKGGVQGAEEEAAPSLPQRGLLPELGGGDLEAWIRGGVLIGMSHPSMGGVAPFPLLTALQADTAAGQYTLVLLDTTAEGPYGHGHAGLPPLSIALDVLPLPSP
jgi:hypothetical protein